MMVIALARAEGIPARLVYGKHISQPVKIWSDFTLAQIKTRSHWWAEVYATDGDGVKRWITVDANSGTNSKWNRTSFSSKGTWAYRGTTTYTWFDPSDRQMSHSFLLLGIYKGANNGKYINRTAEISKLRTFLNRKNSYGKSNGKKLNSNYSSTDFATWGTGKYQNFETDGYGRVSRISWSDKALVGNLSLEGFSKLKYATLWSNSITGVTLKGCTGLLSINLNYNKLTYFDGTPAYNLKEINAKGNKLTGAKFKHSGKTIYIKRSVGSFGFKYKKSASKKVTIYANAAKGYKFMGVYTSSGKKLSSKATYSFYPKYSTYVLKYKRK